MDSLDTPSKQEMLSIIFRYLVKHELYKTAKKLQNESEIEFSEEDTSSLADKKLEVVVGFYCKFMKQFTRGKLGFRIQSNIWEI